MPAPYPGAMPEGHTIHRYARLHREQLGGAPIAVSSPQGRFAAGAARLDGRLLTDVTAAGKHLFYRWAGELTLHVHLGLIGKFWSYDPPDAPPPTAGTRLAMRSPGAVVYLSGPMTCRLVEPDDEDRIRAKLGPDPLLDGANATGFIDRLGRRRVPIGAALLDQAVVAGIGNVYRSELLFMRHLHPLLRADQVSERDAAGLWSTMRTELRRGERSGKIVTVKPGDVGARNRRALADDERLYVYQRDGFPCRRCHAIIRMTEVAGRKLWFCPACQEGPSDEPRRPVS